MDPSEAVALEQRVHDEQSATMSTTRKEVERLPRLVYCTTTAETANAVQALVRPRLGRRGLVDASRCCALLDRAESVDALEDAQYAERHPRGGLQVL